MSRTPTNVPAKRSRPNTKSSPVLSDIDQKLYNLIHSKGNQGIWLADLKRESRMQENMVKKSIASLEAKNLIKLVTNIQGKTRKYYMAVEFEPSIEITGGPWYTDGHLDTDFIDIVKTQCLNHIKRLKIATTEMVSDSIRKSGVFKVECTINQITEIIQVLLLDGWIEQLTSNGMGDFSSIPLGRKCYQALEKKEVVGALSSIPCGVCPVIYECTLDGIISPINCVYYKKWLDF
ncbi:uncharacterized protein [Aristolochia californica]|uniref:uncharacterized protein n=1 Tax=Aristolochia californica TaxID=171875 RepID=UPI0035E0A039